MLMDTGVLMRVTPARGGCGVGEGWVQHGIASDELATLVHHVMIHTWQAVYTRQPTSMWTPDKFDELSPTD
jgi:hypothetical protein